MSRADRNPGGRALANQADEQLTVLLNEAQRGDEQAGQRAWRIIYDDVKAMAAAAAAHEAHHYEPTLIFQEAYLRVRRTEHWENRRHFFAAVRTAIQRFLIDEARRRRARPDTHRTGKLELSFVAGELADFSVATSEAGIELFRALEELEKNDPDQSEVVRLRYIEGLTIEDCAERIGVSPGTVKNRWKAAKAWLQQRLSQAVEGYEPGERAADNGRDA